jgi:hypothetical protein
MSKTNAIIIVAAIILIVVLYLFMQTIVDILSNFGVV